MTDCTQITAPAQPSLVGAVFGYFKAKAKQRQDRAAFQHLLSLEPEILKDIGVTRGDVIWANNLPLNVNAALALECETRPRKHLL